VVHLRIVAPRAEADAALDVLLRTDSVVNVILHRDAARKPDGDVILCDVAREDASVVISDLRGLDIHHCGSISIEFIDTQISDVAIDAERAAPGMPSDAVIWEEVESRTSDIASFSGAFAAFMVLAMLIAAVGIFLDSEILIVGAMVVGPEFGPIAGVVVAFVQRRTPLALRSAGALAVGFPLGIVITALVALTFKVTGVTPESFTEADHDLARSIASPDFLSLFVAAAAGAAGVLSLSTAKSGALIGVLISVTTIPAAANVGVAAAYGQWDTAVGSFAQLALNVSGILVSGVLVLYVQRKLYHRRRSRHLEELDNGRRAVAGS
jgi:uncharacterized hydrophobic protein (TIGR00271 family)